MMKDQIVADTTIELQTVMLDMLQRRAVMEALEEKAIRRVASDNMVLRILGADYLRAQLSDLRKFFEQDGRSHRIGDLTKKFPANSPVHQTHSALFNIWNSQYEQTANRYLLHRQRGYVPPAGHSRSGLDRFIDDMDLFLNELVRGLVQEGYEVSYLAREASYLQEVKADGHKFFSSLS